MWLQRYVVFTRDGVTFDFERSTLRLEGKESGPQETEATTAVEILFQDAPQEAQNLSPLYGVYVDTDLLQAGPEALIGQLNALEPGTAVLLDVKSKFGNFYYTTSLSGATQSDTIDSGAMDRLIHTLKEQGCYLIAQMCIRDRNTTPRPTQIGVAIARRSLRRTRLHVPRKGVWRQMLFPRTVNR